MVLAAAQRFVYVLEGSADLATTSSFHTLAPGGYAYIPLGTEHTLTARTEARLAVIEKKYQPLEDIPAAAILVGQENTVAPVALMGDLDLEVRSLLPDSAAYDFAVNTMTYKPGAALSMVEMHVMEHGLLMLEGGGIYRLGDAWYPVTAGDFIWMWAHFARSGSARWASSRRSTFIYKDWNRHPLPG